jgi:aconitase A
MKIKSLIKSSIFLIILTSCTFNVSMAHTSGTAADVIDDTATNTPNVSPTVTIPMTPGSVLGLK